MARRQALQVLDETDLAAFGEPGATPAGNIRYTARLRLIAPALLGGFDARAADDTAALRSKAARGHLRHWWRLLALAGDFDDCPLPEVPLKGEPAKVRALEARLWGMLGTADKAGMAGKDPEDGESGSPSLIGVDLCLVATKAAQPVSAIALRATFPKLGVALHFATMPDRNVHVPGLEVDLHLTLSLGRAQEQAAMATTLERTVDCWATVGGLGGRTSRGMGAVALLSFTRDDGGMLESPPLWAGNGDVAAVPMACRGVARGVLVTRPGVHAPPFSDSVDALGWGLECLQRFLQVPHGRVEQPAGAQGMSHWPEARLIRWLTQTHYRDPDNPMHHHDPRSTPVSLPGGPVPINVVPRAAFGHRTIQFIHAYTNDNRLQDPDPGQHRILPQGGDRLPSSVIVRAVQLQSNPARFGCLVVQRTDMAGALLPDMQLKPVPHPAPNPTLRAWQPGWTAGTAGGSANIGPLELSGCDSGVFAQVDDAGQAFINRVFNVAMGRATP